MECKICGCLLDEERVEFLISSGRQLTCIKHSNESKVTGLMDYGHKTAPQLVILPNNSESKRLALRAFRRSR